MQGSADPIIIAESEDVPAPSGSKQSQRKSNVHQPKPANGTMKGKGKARGLEHDDPIDLGPLDGVSDASDIEMSIPAPRPRPSPNELSAASTKDDALQRKLLQVSSPLSWKQAQLDNLSILFQSQKTIDSLQKQIDELLKVRIDQHQALDSWKARQETSNGGTSFKHAI